MVNAVTSNLCLLTPTSLTLLSSSQLLWHLRRKGQDGSFTHQRKYFLLLYYINRKCHCAKYINLKNYGQEIWHKNKPGFFFLLLLLRLGSLHVL